MDPKYDLEDRTYKFARSIKEYIKSIKKEFHNIEYLKQLLRSSSSIAANYIEANEALSKKDYLNRLKIVRKEAKETILWLKLIDENNTYMIKEAQAITKIFGAIITKIENNKIHTQPS